MTRFLIVRLGALGDIVHAIPVAAALRRAFPAARIDWLVSAKHREILDLVPVIDRRLAIIDRRGAGRGTSMLAVVGELRRARYDVALDLQGLLKSAVLARSSGAGRVVGFASSHLREPLARLFYRETCDPGGGGIRDPREVRHVVHANLALLAALGIVAPALEFPLDRVDSIVARQIREATDGRYALLNPCAAWPNKRWPPSRFGAVAAGLRDRHGLTPVVLWGPGERAIGEELVGASSGAAVLSPATSIADLVELARGASLMISGDTGPMHLAAAVGTPLVGIFGPTRPARNGPWLPADVNVSRAEVCRCRHRRQCRLATMCLMDIQVDEVLGAVEHRLTAVPAGA